MKTFKHQLPRIFFSINAFLLAFIFLSFSCNAQPTPKRSLIALSKGEHVLVIVDPSTLKTIARISVGEDPHEVIASSDGKTAFISIYGGGAFHELNVIDLINHKPLTNVDTRPLFGPHGITFVDGKVWFSAEGSKAVGRYDPATAKLDWSMGTGQDRTHMIYVSEDGQKVYTTNISSGTVSILLAPESQTAGRHGNWTHAVVPTAVGSEGFDVSIDGKELWTASSNDGTISIIDLPTKKISAKIDAKVFGANRLVFTPDGKQVFISSLRTGDLTIYDALSRKEIKRLKVGTGAAGILMDPVGQRVFVACSADNYISIVDLKTLEITGHFDVGKVPDGLAWAVQE